MMISGLDQGKVASCHLRRSSTLMTLSLIRSVVYFYQLSGAVCTRKLVEIIFSCKNTIFLLLASFGVVETGSMYVRYVPVISANVPCTEGSERG